MGNRNHYTGGKGKPANVRPPKPGAPVRVLITCDECGAQYLTALMFGTNDIHKPCQCGALIHVIVNYDGNGLASIAKGTLESAYKTENP